MRCALGLFKEPIPHRVITAEFPANTPYVRPLEAAGRYILLWRKKDEYRYNSCIK
jgi:hypothetical protein